MTHILTASQKQKLRDYLGEFWKDIARFQDCRTQREADKKIQDILSSSALAQAYYDELKL